ncbi:MAG TPA: Uma2 family endonuclease [Pirellulales bacterium]|nr:Uma2 family endonuclease [Pirellulales bacterium]
MSTSSSTDIPTLTFDGRPENLNTHNAVKGEINSILLQFVKQRRLGRLYVDGALLVCAAADLSTGPDGMFCSQESRRSGRARQKEWTKGSGNPVEVVGVPDLVFEVVSPSTIHKDTKLTPTVFAAHPRWTLLSRWSESSMNLASLNIIYCNAEKS